jgi:hypothetical protein
VPCARNDGLDLIAVLVRACAQEDEPTCPSKFEFDFEFEKETAANTTDWKDLVWQEIAHFHPQLQQ